MPFEQGQGAQNCENIGEEFFLASARLALHHECNSHGAVLKQCWFAEPCGRPCSAR